MGRPKLSEEKRQQVIKALKAGWSYTQITHEFGVSCNTVSWLKNHGEESVAPDPQPSQTEERFADIRKLLKRRPMSAEELADELDCSPRRIRERIEAQRAIGALILDTQDGRFDLGSVEAIEPRRHEISGSDDRWTHVFGFCTDNHLCNKHSRHDVLVAAYDRFEREGITTVYNAGNWIDGEHRFNKGELVTAPGMDHQIEYMIDKYPQRKGITTHYIAGDDHEGWYQQREGVEIGRYLQLRAESAGRADLKYLGYAEADIAMKHGSGEAVMRVVHPGGGSAYAISYTDQKRVESYQGGEKPHVELVGHYHKFNAGYPREVWTAQGGCTCDQTLFMRKKKLQAHVGFSIIRIAQDSEGSISGFCQEFFPFYDRGYYEARF
jgi:biotin operon repressor